jgi:hypothetical protein
MDVNEDLPPLKTERVPTRKPHWKGWEIELVKTMYGPLSAAQVAELLPGRSEHSVHEKVSRLRIKGDRARRSTKYLLTDHGYFSCPGPRNSYWAGFIAADGSVHGGKMLQVFQSDKEVVSKFASCVRYKGPIRSKLSPLSSQPNYSVTIYSRRMVQDLLARYKITPRKSLSLEPPDSLSRECSLAYTCGYIDGDGTICLTGGKLCIGVVGTFAVLKWIRNLFGGGNVYLKPPNNDSPVRSVGPTYMISWSATKAAGILSELCQVQGLDDLRLPRKWDVYKRWNSLNAA